MPILLHCELKIANKTNMRTLGRQPFGFFSRQNYKNSFNRQTTTNLFLKKYILSRNN